MIDTLPIVSGCVEATDSRAPAPSSPPFITMFASSVGNAAVNACRSAMQGELKGPVQTVGSGFSQANSAICFRVGSNGAPWRCLAANDGRGAREPMFIGSEGAA